MNGRVIFRIVLAVVVLAILAVAGVAVFNAGAAYGVSQSAALAAPDGEALARPYYVGPYGWGRPFGFGFGFLGCLVPLLFIFLAFGLVRGLFWRPWGWGRGWRGHHGGGMPPMFEEWHKRAHGQAESQDQPPATPA